MCGIFGIISKEEINLKSFKKLANLSERRGRDSSGILFFNDETYSVRKADYSINKLINETDISKTSLILGHSRLITNSQQDNQPVVKKELAVIHNGIILDNEIFWNNSSQNQEYEIDTEILLAITLDYLNNHSSLDDLYKKISRECKGSFSCSIIFPKLGKMALLSNTGSLYFGNKNNQFIFASEEIFLNSIGVNNISQLKGLKIIDIPESKKNFDLMETNLRRANLIPSFSKELSQARNLIFNESDLKRCKKCILPETMPFIKFNENGICNYCENYSPKNSPKPKETLIELLKSYEKFSGKKCIVPFSGGRDSSYALHIIKKELGMDPITMTYDWGMVTDLARRNISRMCSELGVENIIIADNIELKRKNIRMNLKSWLKKPHLGMLNILMAGDKHFFRHIETIKKELQISLNIWGMNPMEVTHFKAGFLGFSPDFETKQVFYTGLSSQIRYQFLRFKEMVKNPSYFNSSLWDTLSGEYYRSVKRQTDFYNAYDYWHWDEEVINKTLEGYSWETAVDTSSTWRIGDGTAAFYNYVYYTMAGFSEYDTFRSNQIREGQISRDKALNLVKEENKPRFENIRWYLDAIEMDFDQVIEVINKNHKKYFPK